jgi:hypothetical protein
LTFSSGAGGFEARPYEPMGGQLPAWAAGYDLRGAADAQGNDPTVLADRLRARPRAEAYSNLY